MLKRKLFREIGKNLSQFITILLMVMIGVMAYSGIEAYMDGMITAADKFYSENNLQDLNVMGAGFTTEDLDTVKDLPHVRNAERKLVFNAINSDDNDKGFVVSFIESNEISKFYLEEGIPFDANTKGVWVDSWYMRENGLKIGDKIRFKYDSLELEEVIVGSIQVPDHIYDIKDESALLPDHSSFGFVFLSVNEISESYIKEIIMKEAGISNESILNILMPNLDYKTLIPFNYIMVDVDEKENVDSVKNSIEDKIESAQAIIKIEDSLSYSTYQGEIDEGRGFVGIFSGLFLFIAILSVITTMTRVIKKQRIQIGTLKALGFSDLKVQLHYIGYGFWVSLIGACLGLLAGKFFIGSVFMGLEMDFFELPNDGAVMNPLSYLVAALVVLGISFVTYLTCRKQLKENPAETLRIELPKVKSGTLGFTTTSVFKKMKFATKWNIRDVIRNKIRTLTAIVGITGCCVLIVCALGMLNSIDHFIDLQFEELYNFSYRLSLKQDIKTDEIKVLTDEYGDKTSKTLGIEIKDSDGNREANTVFVHDAGDYVRFVDKNNDFMTLDRDDGVYITHKLGENENIKIGDTITWHIYGSKDYYESKVVGYNKDPQTQGVTATRSYIESLGIDYIPDSIYTNIDLSNKKDIPNVELVQDKSNLKENISGMLEMMRSMIVIIIFVAVLLGVIIIYSMSILSYSEKQYQFSTLKVLGFEDSKIRRIFIKQNNWIAIAAIIIGLPLGRGLTSWLFKICIDEKYDIDTHIYFITYLLGAAGTFLVSFVVSAILGRKVNSIDMVSSLKSNE
ncbi:MAG: ABC transporter permease [Lachnospiraceae bacterium]|nr:ABC transporter permease [Lachnospiraceae bacterium]